MTATDHRGDAAGPPATAQRPGCPSTGLRAGFTLVELLVAMALTIMFGAMAVGVLRYGTQLWRSGNRRSYTYDTAAAVFSQLREDVQAANSVFWTKDSEAYDSRIKFVADYDGADRQRLRFVRTIPDAALNPRIRAAGNAEDDDGDGSVDEERYNLRDDEVPPDGQIDEDLMPLEGMTEVAYARGTAAEDVQTLYRAVNAPIGGAESLFTTGALDSPADVALPLTENVVLYFELRFWSQHTTTWNTEAPWAPWPDSWTMQWCGPRFDWDSENRHDEARDDIFPRAVMAVVVVEPPERLQRPNRLRLREEVTEGQTQIPVTGTLPAYNRSWPYALIRDPDGPAEWEWFQFEEFDVDNQQFVLSSARDRGTRFTADAAQRTHQRGSEVVIGYTFSSVFHNPTGKEYWGQ